mgnify:FL=1
MGICYFCESPEKDRESYYQYYCAECKKLQRILKLYRDDVYEVCDKVFIRDKKQQEFKVKNLGKDNKSMDKVKTRSQVKNNIVDEVD